MRSLSYPFASRTRWNSQPLVNIQALSCPQESVIIRLPKGLYSVGAQGVDPEIEEVDATFFIGTELTGTPLQVAQRLGRNDIVAGELAKYTDGKNHWLLSREVSILNGQVAFISLPTSVKTFVVGSGLMMNSSRMAKVFKERIIPDIVESFGDNAVVKIMNTYNYMVRIQSQPTKVVTDDSIKKVILENIEEAF